MKQYQIDVHPDNMRAHQVTLSVSIRDVQDVIEIAIGGMNIGTGSAGNCQAACW
ncbi:MAG TPA: hypothetical protein VMN36_01900 [Verrucomicrobiales bacterium]|nr:hypothetical protein [Verrucomicrobiales bacterium]